jgi:hypothetical protein
VARNVIRRLLACLVALLAAWPAATAGAAPVYKAMWGPEDAFDIYRDLGVGIYQTSINWSAAAPARPAAPWDPADPAYVWPAGLDATIERARAGGVRVMLMLTGAPEWANGGKPSNYAPIKPADYAEFAAAAARRYPNVKLWMVWGEPSRVGNFAPLIDARPGEELTPAQARAPRRYAAILDAAYAALKSVSPLNLVIGGNTYSGGDIRARQWIKHMRLAGGKRPRLDLYGHNPFSLRKPDLRKPQSRAGITDFSSLDELSTTIQRYLRRPGRSRIKLFLSEWTIPTARGDSEFNFWVTPETQADWIRAAFTIARRTSLIYALGWIHLYDDPPGGSKGGLLDSQGVKKPGYYAFKAG